jgi:hypothetical protein
MIFLNSNPYLAQRFTAAGQIYFDFDGNSSEVNYRTYENMTAGVRIKYPSNWNMLESLGNVSGNNIIADFYLTGINGTNSYSENANVVVLNQSEYLKSVMKKYLDTSVGSFAIQCFHCSFIKCSLPSALDIGMVAATGRDSDRHVLKGHTLTVKVLLHV